MNLLHSHLISSIGRRRFFQNIGKLGLSGAAVTLGIGDVSVQHAHASGVTTNRTSWVHGNAGLIQTDDPLGNGYRIIPTYTGPYLFLETDGNSNSAWIHYSVPIHHDGLTLQLMAVQILFNARETVLDAIAVFDGPKEIQSWAPQQSGNHISLPSVFSLSSLHTVQYGLGVSLHFTNMLHSFGPDYALLIATVGAAFYDS